MNRGTDLLELHTKSLLSREFVLAPGSSSMPAKKLSNFVLNELMSFLPCLGSVAGSFLTRRWLGRLLNSRGPFEWNPLFRADRIHAGMLLSVVNFR